MIPRLFAASLLMSWTLTACWEPGTADREAPTREATPPGGPRPAEAVLAAAVDSLATRIVAEGLTPGFGVAVVMDGRTILARSYGVADGTAGVPADDRTLWYIASTSKSLTGFATALLAYQGAIDLQAPIPTLLPAAQWPAGVDANQLTLRRFLSHTHQLDDDAIVMASAFTGALPESTYPVLLQYARPMAEPQLAYSNLGYNVAAMVIDAARPEGWRRYLDSAVHHPAGMTETYTRVSGLEPRRVAMPHVLHADGSHATAPFAKTDATMHGAGGHLATLRDLARWVTVQLDSGVIDGRQVFPIEAVALAHRMIAPQTREDAMRFAWFDRDGWAAGWDIGAYRGERMVSRFGGYASTRSHLSFLPARRIGVVSQANGDFGSPATDIIAAFAYDLEAGRVDARTLADERLQALIDRYQDALAERARADSVRVSPTPRRPLGDFTGTYHHEWYGTITFTLLADSLAYDWGVVHGVADLLDARSCRWFRCTYSTALLIDVGGNSVAVEFDFPDAGPARALTLRGETFRRE